MAYDIGPRIGIEGEAEYRKALQQIITTQKTLATEMQATSSAFDKGEKSMASYTAKNAVLEKQIAAQREKMELLRRAVDEATQKYGEADTRTQKWQQVMNRATAELNEMERELRDNKAAMEEFDDGLRKVGKDCDATGKEYKNFIDRLKDNATFTDVINLARAAAGAIREIADAAISLATDAVMAFADTEQLVGGVETLFGRSAYIVENNAKKAFETAGLSANEYMETVTSFSASLLQNLGGNTVEAAHLADQAIRDMADNANKMGSDMASIQNAYQGFAKQNYTMLDNLKLGYGGTKSEAERLLADAEALNDGFRAQRDEAGKLTLAYTDMIQAIHIVQDNMGITGATAEEAAKTISGAISSMKAAGTNLLSGIANPDADVAALTADYTKTIKTVVKNVAPAAKAAISGMIGAGSQMASELAPELLKTGGELLTEIVDGMIQSAPEMAQSAGAIVSELAVGIVNMAPQLVELGLIVLESFIEGIAENTDTLVPAIVDAIIKITETLLEHLPDLIAAAGELIGALASGLIQAIPQLVMQIPQIIAAILTALGEGFVEFLGIGVKMVEGIISGIKDSIGWVKEQVSAWVGDVIGFFKDMLGIHSPSDVMADLVGYQMGAGVGEGFAEGLSDAERDMAAAQEKLNRDLAGMAAGLETSTTVNMGTGPIEHHYSGTIRVEGVTDSGQFIASTDLLIEDLIDRLRREVRFA